MTGLKYTEKKNPFDASDVEDVDTSVMAYDLEQLKNQFTQTFMGLGIMAFLHLRFGYVRPILLQSIFGFKTLYATPLFKVHFMNEEAVDKLKRPWKTNPFG
jgi:hypothetical protein